MVRGTNTTIERVEIVQIKNITLSPLTSSILPLLLKEEFLTIVQIPSPRRRGCEAQNWKYALGFIPFLGSIFFCTIEKNVKTIIVDRNPAMKGTTMI